METDMRIISNKIKKRRQIVLAGKSREEQKYNIVCMVY